jgi:hypothetical protein
VSETELVFGTLNFTTRLLKQVFATEVEEDGHFPRFFGIVEVHPLPFRPPSSCRLLDDDTIATAAPLRSNKPPYIFHVAPFESEKPRHRTARALRFPRFPRFPRFCLYMS